MELFAVYKRPVILALSTILVILLSQSCNPFGDYEINYPEGFFPDTATNLRDVNTQYDDYNSAGPPTIAYSIPLLFSTNRSSKGDQFDVADWELFLNFDQDAGVFSMTAMENVYPYFYLTSLVNTSDNEFGPYILASDQNDYYYYFASDRNGSMDIYASYFNDYSFSGFTPIKPDPFRVPGLSRSDSYEAYATFMTDFSTVVYCSNRDGNLDLYQTYLPDNPDLLVWAQADTLYPAEQIEILNTEAEEVCPYINGNLMVFVSKRPGGFGGYDIYYTRYTEGNWTEPKNMGENVNTEYDEYRPITFFASYFENDLMIFSSNRPGGKGGFDLYYAGIPKITEDW